MSQVELYCEQGDHKWFRESQRGRKPQNCPEHQDTPVTAQKPAQEPLEPQEQELWCQKGQHFYKRPPTRGKRPLNCPEHKEAPAPPVRAKGLEETDNGSRALSEEHKQKLIQGRKEAAERKAREQLEAKQVELKSLDEKITEADLRYQEALEDTNKAVETERLMHLFDIADRRQTQLMGLLARKRALERQVRS